VLNVAFAVGGVAGLGWWLSAKASSQGAGAVAGEPRKLSRLGWDVTRVAEDVVQSEASGLSAMGRRVTLEGGTERAFTGTTTDGTPWDAKGRGTYCSAVGGLPLFSSDAKFDSGTGWPSFWAPVDPDHVEEVPDLSIPFMPRVEVRDRRTGAHLGHVFTDGPKEVGGKRYCINAAALTFVPSGQECPLPKANNAQDD